ncbi:MAG: phage tail sheath C-terminal domain-containing protein [Alphaproteobacteria bacterium]
MQTAVPAFIGYTAKAVVNGKSAAFTPVPVNSLADFEAAFGGAFNAVYDIAEVAGPPAPYHVAATRWDAATQQFVTKFYALARTNATFNLYNSVRLFYASGGGPCYVVSIGDYTAAGSAPGGVAIDAAKLTQGLTAIGAQAGPTMLVVPDAVLLKPDATPSHGLPVSTAFNALAQAMLAQCGALQDRVAILDVYGADALNSRAPKNGTFDNDLTFLTENFQNGVGDSFLNYGMAYFPFLVTSVVQPNEIDYRNFNIGEPDQLALLQGILTDTASQLYSDPPNADPAQNRNPQFLAVKAMIAAIATTTGAGPIARLNQNLVNAVSLLQQMENIIATKMNLLPPSGAMAGVYTLVDSSRGVWNAPANVTPIAVVSASGPISAEQQEPLNVPLNGKAVNVIRDFVGRGPVVWGARTLDGNSSDWRYINVRRTFIYIEQSIKLALQALVFEPNVATTWVAVTAMASSFLRELWQQGGLTGTTPQEAFSVQCGLGRTMTANDILEGNLIVQVTMAMIRPAEFIVLVLKQKMQGGT